MLTRRAVAESWRANAYLPLAWRPANGGHLRQGHGGGVIAIDASLGRPAYIKPRSPMVPEASALEKIASDLAHDLGIELPPVVLTDPPTGWTAANRQVCASLVVYGHQLHWGGAQHGVQLRPGSAVADDPAQHARAALLHKTAWGRLVATDIPIQAARAFVFDSWVGQPDHNHPSNIVWGIDTKDAGQHGLCFFDYEMAFGVGGWAAVGPAPFPEEMLAGMDRGEVAATIARVEAMQVAPIRAIVDRIPVRFMQHDRKEDLLQQLLTRRETLREVLAAFVESTG